MRRFLLLLILIVLPLRATDPTGVFIGAAAGQDRRWSVDIALATSIVQTSAWGAHMGFLGYGESGTSNPNGIPHTTKPSGAYTDTLNFQGYQFGAYADWGRAWAALGVEHTTETLRTYTVDAKGLWSVQPDAQKVRTGGYLKVGMKLSACSIYVGYGTRSEFVAGLGLHF